MPKRPSPFKGEGQEGEVRHFQPVMLNASVSAVKHPRAGFTSPCFGDAETSLSFLKERDNRVRFAIPNLSC
jgi:hypothetical protein